MKTACKLLAVGALSGVVLFLPVVEASPQAKPNQVQIEAKSAEVNRQEWDAGTRYPNWQAPSELELEKLCKRPHSFSVSIEPGLIVFLDLQFTSPVLVPSRSSVTKPVLFHTNGLSPVDYTMTG